MIGKQSRLFYWLLPLILPIGFWAKWQGRIPADHFAPSLVQLESEDVVLFTQQLRNSSNSGKYPKKESVGREIVSLKTGKRTQLDENFIIVDSSTWRDLSFDSRRMNNVLLDRRKRADSNKFAFQKFIYPPIDVESTGSSHFSKDDRQFDFGRYAIISYSGAGGKFCELVEYDSENRSAVITRKRLGKTFELTENPNRIVARDGTIYSFHPGGIFGSISHVENDGTASLIDTSRPMDPIANWNTATAGVYVLGDRIFSVSVDGLTLEVRSLDSGSIMERFSLNPLKLTEAAAFKVVGIFPNEGSVLFSVRRKADDSREGLVLFDFQGGQVKKFAQASQLISIDPYDGLVASRGMALIDIHSGQLLWKSKAYAPYFKLQSSDGQQGARAIAIDQGWSIRVHEAATGKLLKTFYPRAFSNAHYVFFVATFFAWASAIHIKRSKGVFFLLLNCVLIYGSILLYSAWYLGAPIFASHSFTIAGGPLSLWTAISFGIVVGIGSLLCIWFSFSCRPISIRLLALTIAGPCITSLVMQFAELQRYDDIILKVLGTGVGISLLGWILYALGFRIAKTDTAAIEEQPQPIDSVLHAVDASHDRPASEKTPRSFVRLSIMDIMLFTASAAVILVFWKTSAWVSNLTELIRDPSCVLIPFTIFYATILILWAGLSTHGPRFRWLITSIFLWVPCVCFAIFEQYYVLRGGMNDSLLRLRLLSFLGVVVMVTHGLQANGYCWLLRRVKHVHGSASN